MGRPQGNGIVELHDEERKTDNVGWNCMDFHLFSFDEEDKSWEASHARFLAAQSGNCPYIVRCPRFNRTFHMIGNQLRLFLPWKQ